MSKSKKARRNKVEKVMHEFKAGKLRSSSGDLVTNRKQAIAIALSVAGESIVVDSLDRLLTEDDGSSREIHDLLGGLSTAYLEKDIARHRGNEDPHPWLPDDLREQVHYFRSNDDSAGLLNYLKSIKRPVQESEDDPYKNVVDLDSERWKRVPKNPPVYDGGSAEINKYVGQIEQINRSQTQVPEPKGPEQRMKNRVLDGMAKRSDDLFNQLHAQTEGKGYPESIVGALKEHAKDYEHLMMVFGDHQTSHTFLARTQAMLASHDPNHTATPLSQEVTKHLGIVLSHPHTNAETRKHIELAQRLGDIEGLKGSPTFTSEFDKYD